MKKKEILLITNLNSIYTTYRYRILIDLNIFKYSIKIGYFPLFQYSDSPIYLN